MPNLNLGGSKTSKAKGLANIGAAMERRQQERNGNTPIADAATVATKKEIALNVEKDPASKLYEAGYASIGPGTARRYEKGNPPRQHLEYLEAISVAMEGREEAEIVLAPINDRLAVARSQAKKILTCLERYGYLSLRRKSVGSGVGSGRSIIFRVIKKHKK